MIFDDVNILLSFINYLKLSQNKILLNITLDAKRERLANILRHHQFLSMQNIEVLVENVQRKPQQFDQLGIRGEEVVPHEEVYHDGDRGYLELVRADNLDDHVDRNQGPAADLAVCVVRDESLRKLEVEHKLCVRMEAALRTMEEGNRP